MALIAAIQFLTTIRLPIRKNFSPEQFGASIAYYPLVGFLIGALLVVAGVVLEHVFDQALVAALLLIGWVLLTGGLHLDGLMDACDGLLSHRSAEERLRIMRDSHVGAWGVIGGVLTLITKFAVLLAVFNQPSDKWVSGLLLAPTLARWTMSLCVSAFPYGREEGIGRVLKEHGKHTHLAVATTSAAVITLLIQPVLGMLAFLLVIVATLLLARFALDRLPGLTGDVYGMIAEVSEVVVLLTFALRLP